MRRILGLVAAPQSDRREPSALPTDSATAAPSTASPPRHGPPPPGPAGLPLSPLPLSPLAALRQLIACGLLMLLSARLPARLAALAMALSRPPVDEAPGSAAALAMLSLDAFGVLCAIYLSHGRLRGVPLLRCYPPQRLIPLSLHLLGLLWGLLTLALPGGASGR